MEIFRDIIGYEGIYQISDLGTVKSLRRTVLKNGKHPFFMKEAILTNSLNDQGYLRVGLTKNGKVKTEQVHVLVARAFLNHSTCGYDIIVDHKNNIRSDNRLDNLQLITVRTNTSKDRKNGSSKFIGVYWNKSKERWVSRIRIGKTRKQLGVFTSEIEAANKYQEALSSLTK
jgi:hypothetical protein